MERTPYGISAKDKGYSPSLYGFQHMFADGYVMVFQDIRGRFGSEGQFVMNRPVHDASDAKGSTKHGHLRHDRVAGEKRAQ